MSRIGKRAIALPKGVKVSVNGQVVTVEGPKGRLERTVHRKVSVRVEGTEVFVERTSNENEARAMHGLTRTLLNNMVRGVVEPFKRTIEISGVGYRADIEGGGKVLSLQAGFSHDVKHPIPAGVTVTVEKQVVVHLVSADNELLGKTASEIRGYRPAEPYQGKGLKYAGEKVRRKEGKTGAS